MDSKDEIFLQNYHNTKNSASGESKAHRQCLAQMHNYSLNNLDERNTCQQLEQNLHIYNDMLREGNEAQGLDNRIKDILSQTNTQSSITVRSNLSNIDIKSILTPLPCQATTKNVACARSEEVARCDYNKFIRALQSSQPAKIPLIKERKIAKNFSPQFCTPSKVQEVSRSNFNENKATACTSSFITAKQELEAQNMKKYGTNYSQSLPNNLQKRRLGIRRKPNSKFVPPLLSYNSNEENLPKSEEWPSEVDERLKNIDPKMVELIKSEIMDIGSTIGWGDIAGLEFAKSAIQEAVIWPMLRPDIFKGLRRPPKGILLFGPPGTGKTLIGKCVASQSKSTFFSISASSLTSKWVGDGEKMVRALFAVARCHQPAVIFIDEIDSLLSQRSDTEHESSRRIKTEFLVQLDGATTDSEERLLLIGATNRPQELDEAARRRFVKRLYIPLPEFEARLQLIMRLISGERHELAEEHFNKIAQLSAGYSGADIKNLCSEASLGPIRSISMEMIEKIEPDEVRALTMEDFEKAFERVRSSVSPTDLNQYVTWDQTYGSGL